MPYPFPHDIKESRTMIFIDGENLAIRYANLLGNSQPLHHVKFEPNIYVWSSLLNLNAHRTVNTIRRYYFTSTRGDENRRHEIHDKLYELGIQAPRFFPKNKNRGSKQVDISLSVEMLSHAHSNNYDVAVLVAGDQDYVPLVEAVKAQGRQVFVWFVQDGLSPMLRRSADYFFDLGEILLDEKATLYMT